MFENPLEAVLLVAAGIFIGGIVQLFYWRRPYMNTEESLVITENTMKKKDKQLKGLNTNLKGQKSEIETLNLELSDREEELAGLRSSLEEQKELASKLKTYAGAILKQNKEHELTIETLNGEVTAHMNQSQDLILSMEKSETRIHQLEKNIRELEEWNHALRSRMQHMQDDLSIIDGIGPRVEGILRAAKVNTFGKLASLEPDEISKILEDKDPRLVRLTDPSSWPRQAKLAGEEDWEGLSALKFSLKESAPAK